jgi:hypothetical protein
LTAEELLDVSDKAGKLNDQIRRIEAEFDAQKQIAKNKIGSLSDELEDLLTIQSTKKELRTVDCDISLNTDEGITEFYYKGIKVDSRIMTEDDKQETFFNL